MEKLKKQTIAFISFTYIAVIIRYTSISASNDIYYILLTRHASNSMREIPKQILPFLRELCPYNVWDCTLIGDVITPCQNSYSLWQKIGK